MMARNPALSRIVPAEPKNIALIGDKPSFNPSGTASFTSSPGMRPARKVVICGGRFMFSLYLKLIFLEILFMITKIKQWIKN